MTTPFQLGLAQFLADASKAAYEQTPTIVGKATDTQLLIIETEHRTILSFRGSSSERDWYQDAEVLFKDFYGVEIHHGVADAITEILPQLHPYLQTHRGPFVFDGHSLGGVEAMVTAWYAKKNGSDVEAVYTFGQFRPGNDSFRDSYRRLGLDAITWRVVNNRDGVTRWPPSVAGYRHCGNEAFINSAGKLNLNPSWFRKLKSDFQSWDLADIALDHPIDHYIERLNAL
jgi:hypothetical protein